MNPGLLLRPVFGGANLFCLLKNLLLLLFLLPVQGVFAAVPSTLEKDGGDAAEGDEPGKDRAVAAISGSQWPGIIDHLLQRPIEENESAAGPIIHINYPSTGNIEIDKDIRHWVGSIAEAFEEHLEIPPRAEDEIDLQIDRFLQDDDLPSQMALENESDSHKFELWGNYQVSRPSDKAISIIFEIWNYASGGEGNLDVLTLNYSLLTGQRLSLVDIFEDPNLALQLMAAWSRKNLASRLGETGRNRMLDEGTAPIAENYSSLSLTGDGLCINFQPWQVAPGIAGIQKVEMPLSELLPAGPLLTLWDR